MRTYTAGPWYHEENSEGKRIVWAFDHPGEPRIPVAAVYDNRRAEANATLLAAAPAMLNALETMLGAAQLAGSGQELPHSWAEYCEIIGSVIAKAKGATK